MEGETKAYFLFWFGTAAMIILGLGLLALAIFYQNYFIRIKLREGRQLLAATLEGERNERRRLAADLHDGISGDMVAIKMFVNILMAKAGDPAHRKMFDDIATSLDRLILNTRQTSQMLMPPLLETRGLKEALQENFRQIQRSTVVRFSVDWKDDLTLDEKKCYELYRIIQEFAANALKHGTAGSFSVTADAVTKAMARILIYDSGKAFSFEECSRQSLGAGLRNIELRINMIGAKLSQLSANEGNVFQILIPQQ